MPFHFRWEEALKQTKASYDGMMEDETLCYTKDLLFHHGLTNNLDKIEPLTKRRKNAFTGFYIQFEFYKTNYFRLQIRAT